MLLSGLPSYLTDFVNHTRLFVCRSLARICFVVNALVHGAFGDHLRMHKDLTDADLRKISCLQHVLAK